MLVLIYAILWSVFTMNAISEALPCVKIETRLGKIILAIDRNSAPATAENFLAHMEAGTFNEAVFYRTVRMDNQPENDIKIEVIQGGLFDEEAIDKHPVIRHETTNETGLRHLDGTISMARVEPGTASTEFFICIGDQPELDFGGKRNPDGQGFAAFGKVIEGMDVVRKIQQLPDEKQYLKEPVKIISTDIISF